QGTGNTAPNQSALSRMEGATLNVLTNNDFVPLQNELRFTNSPSFSGNATPAGALVGTQAFTTGTITSFGQGIIPWATLTTFVGGGAEQVDLVTDMAVTGFDLNFGGSQLSLGKISIYDSTATAG